MLDVFFDSPPVLQGDERTQLNQLKNYLFTISNKLNEAMMTISVEEIAEKAAEKAQQVTAAEDAGMQDRYTVLKSLIIKTAEIVRHEMDEITTHLEDNLEALSSQFGSLQQNLTADITATAEGVLQSYGYDEKIEGLEDANGNTESYIRQTNQYIFTGLLDSTTNPPTYGIAVGDGVTKNDGTLNGANKCATFTKDRMSFWQGGTELAYFSSGKFYIRDGEITNTLTIGNYMWKKITGGAIALIALGNS